ncbi:LysR family transcriptional regulator [Salmonella enterica subsp. enterica serovar Choleraesuis]|nr:LysR family transcriptional regulator [Salmonella enterica subsp. enterica serovar Choleraesuis]
MTWWNVINYDISLLEMKLFVMTARLGNFSEVARRVDMTPSAVSRKMSHLEQKLGSKLFHRHTRALSLTEEGNAFVKSCCEIITQYEGVASRIEHNADTPRGTVKISAPVAFGRLHLAPYVSELLERYPLLRLEIMQTDDYIDPAAEGIDLLIRIGVLKDSTLRVRHFAQQNYVIAASPGYLHAFGTPQSPDQLASHNCLVFKGTMGLQRWFAGQDKLTPWEVSGSLYSNNAETLVSAAVGGSGLVMFPTWLISDELKTGRLVPILQDYQVCPTQETQTIAALYLDTHNLAPKVRVVIDFLSEKFGQPCYWDRN